MILSHLTHPDQRHWEAIQDDEALMLFAVVRGCRFKRILEIGGYKGYSAKNFCEAASIFPDSVVYSLDINDMVCVAENHRTIKLDVVDLKPHHVDNIALDLIFFDCHVDGQFIALESLKPLITEDTVIALHDTNYQYRQFTGEALEAPRLHQIVEPMLVNHLHKMGYDAFSIRTLAKDHSEQFPHRHGLTLMQKYRELK